MLESPLELELELEFEPELELELSSPDVVVVLTGVVVPPFVGTFVASGGVLTALGRLPVA